MASFYIPGRNDAHQSINGKFKDIRCTLFTLCKLVLDFTQHKLGVNVSVFSSHKSVGDSDALTVSATPGHA